MTTPEMNNACLDINRTRVNQTALVWHVAVNQHGDIRFADIYPERVQRLADANEYFYMALPPGHRIKRSGVLNYYYAARA